MTTAQRSALSQHLVAPRRLPLPLLLLMLGAGAIAAAVGADLIGAGGQSGFGAKQTALLVAGLLSVLASAVLASPSAVGFLGRHQDAARRIVVGGGCALVAIYSLASYWRAQGPGNSTYFIDEGVYTYIGWAWSQGSWPYRDSWDQKGPIVYMTTLARSVLGGNGVQALRVQELALGVTTALVVAGIAWLLWGSRSAPVAFALGVLVLTQAPPYYGHVSTPASLVALFEAGAILTSLAAARARSLRMAALMAAAMGVCSGLALSTKPTAVGLGVAAIVLWWLGRSTVRERLLLTLVAVVAAAAPVTALALLFYYAGALDALIDAYIVYNGAFGRLMLEARSPVDLLLEIPPTLDALGVWRLFAGTMAVTALVALWQTLRRSPRGELACAGSLLAILWLAAEVAALASNGGRIYQVQPLLYAVALGATAILTAFRGRSVVTHACALGAFLVIVIPQLHAVSSYGPPRSAGWLNWDVAADTLAATTTSDDTVLNLDHPLALALANRHSASPYLFRNPIGFKGSASNEKWQELAGLLEGGKPPKVIMIAVPPAWERPAGGPTREWLLGGYDPQTFWGRFVDWTDYPARARFKEVAAEHYRLGECSGGFCFLYRG